MITIGTKGGLTVDVKDDFETVRGVMGTGEILDLETEGGERVAIEAIEIAIVAEISDDVEDVEGEDIQEEEEDGKKEKKGKQKVTAGKGKKVAK